jgi:hypothetical protein
MKFVWFPLAVIVSLTITVTMISFGFSAPYYFLANLLVGAILGYVTGKAGYEA